jgi:hypothetical protein
MSTKFTAAEKLCQTTMVILIIMSTILGLRGLKTHPSVESSSLSVLRHATLIVHGLYYHPFYINVVLSHTTPTNGSAFQEKRVHSM